VLGQPRSTQRREAHAPDDESALVRRIVELATRYGRYGYRRIAALLRAEGFRVNHKQVERLWRREVMPRRGPVSTLRPPRDAGWDRKREFASGEANG
jgi:transposase InsO family protein